MGGELHELRYFEFINESCTLLIFYIGVVLLVLLRFLSDASFPRLLLHRDFTVRISLHLLCVNGPNLDCRL